ncbi:hypothetical protein KIW84_020940, partial [Lathyrus oleraceus]
KTLYIINQVAKMNVKSVIFLCFLSALLLIASEATEPSKDEKQATIEASKTKVGVDRWGFGGFRGFRGRHGHGRHGGGRGGGRGGAHGGEGLVLSYIDILVVFFIIFFSDYKFF